MTCISVIDCSIKKYDCIKSNLITKELTQWIHGSLSNNIILDQKLNIFDFEYVIISTIFFN